MMMLFSTKGASRALTLKPCSRQAASFVTAAFRRKGDCCFQKRVIQLWSTTTAARRSSTSTSAKLSAAAKALSARYASDESSRSTSHGWAMAATAATAAAAAAAVALATATAGVALVGGNGSHKSCGDSSNNNNLQSAESRQEPSLLHALTAATSATRTTFCAAGVTPANVAKEDFDQVQKSHDVDSMPVYTSEQVAQNNGDDGTPVWMTYGGVVYDVTDFVANHPGGSQKILQAAGSAMEPFWHVYRQHFATDLPMRLMEHMAIGRLDEEDQTAIDESMAILEEDDPYAQEPMRHAALLVHSDTPMNAEVPSALLTQSYLTPNSIFYIRHHHPVPFLSQKQTEDFRLQVDLSALGIDKPIKLTMDELRAMPKTEIVATLQCSGNRRAGFNTLHRTSGTPWGQGAVSTAKFGGVKLRTLLEHAGVKDFIAAQEEQGIEHVRFHGLDGMMASIGIEKAVNPYGDVLVCYEMNGEELPRDHGFPLRVIVPGYAAVRNVKWLSKIELAHTEAEGAWQRGLNYKTLPPSVTDAKSVDLSQMPSMTEVSLFSGITGVQRVGTSRVNPGDRVQMRVMGWAWAGGGRNIVRVDCTGDGGKSWTSATLGQGNHQRFGRAWAWTFWECTVPAVVMEDGSVRLASKAVDLAFNVQPESSDHTWNVRGLGNNSWYRAQVRVA